MSLVISYRPSKKKPDHFEVRRNDWPPHHCEVVKVDVLQALKLSLKIVGITCIEVKS